MAIGGGAISVAVTSAFARPGALARITAVWVTVVAGAGALTVTCCCVEKIAGVNVRGQPPVTEMLVSPDALATVTVTLPAGAADRLTPYCALPPSGTLIALTLVRIIGTELAISVAVTSTLVRPGALTRMSAVPVPVVPA